MGEKQGVNILMCSVRVCVCMCVCVCVYVCKHIATCMYVGVCEYMYAHIICGGGGLYVHACMIVSCQHDNMASHQHPVTNYTSLLRDSLRIKL